MDPQKKAPRGRTLQPNEETGHKKRIGFSFFIKEEKGLRPCLQKLGSILARISVYSLTSSTSNYVARSLHSTERRHELQETNQDSSSFQRQEKKQTTRNESGSLVLSSLSEAGPSVTFFCTNAPYMCNLSLQIVAKMPNLKNYVPLPGNLNALFFHSKPFHKFVPR